MFIALANVTSYHKRTNFPSHFLPIKALWSCSQWSIKAWKTFLMGIQKLLPIKAWKSNLYAVKSMGIQKHCGLVRSDQCCTNYGFQAVASLWYSAISFSQTHPWQLSQFDNKKLLDEEDSWSVASSYPLFHITCFLFKCAFNSIVLYKLALIILSYT